MSVTLTELNVFHILRYLFKINDSVVFICPTAHIFFMLPWFEAFSSKIPRGFRAPSPSYLRNVTSVKKVKQSHYRPGQALRVPGV